MGSVSRSRPYLQLEINEFFHHFLLHENSGNMEAIYILFTPLFSESVSTIYPQVFVAIELIVDPRAEKVKQINID